jgi:L-glyceraldehyde 3-phosphate reductase
VNALNIVAHRRNQSLAQMAIGWVLKDPRITSVIIGASKPEQVMDSVQCLKNIEFNKEELNEIEEVLSISS